MPKVNLDPNVIHESDITQAANAPAPASPVPPAKTEETLEDLIGANTDPPPSNETVAYDLNKEAREAKPWQISPETENFEGYTIACKDSTIGQTHYVWYATPEDRFKQQNGHLLVIKWPHYIASQYDENIITAMCKESQWARDNVFIPSAAYLQNLARKGGVNLFDGMVGARNFAREGNKRSV